MNSFILVFPSDALWLTADAEPLEQALDLGDELYALDGNVAFLHTDQELETLTERLRAAYFKDRQFFLADIGEASRAGNMLPAFWSRFSMRAAATEAA